MNHTEIDLDPNEQTAARYRLYSRSIRVIGMSQISTLQPYLQAKLEKTLFRAIGSRPAVDGIYWTRNSSSYTNGTFRLAFLSNRSYDEGSGVRNAGTIYLWGEAMFAMPFRNIHCRLTVV